MNFSLGSEWVDPLHRRDQSGREQFYRVVQVDPAWRFNEEKQTVEIDPTKPPMVWLWRIAVASGNSNRVREQGILLTRKFAERLSQRPR